MASKASDNTEPERTHGLISSSFQNSQQCNRSSIQLSEKDIPGASLCGHDPSELHVVELKLWLKCRGANTTGRKPDQTVSRLAMSLVHVASARQEQVDAALLYNILDYVELGIAAIPEDKTCSDKPQQWSRLKTSASNGPILFSEIQFVHHTYGKHKPEAAALRMEEHNNYPACPEPLRPISEEQIRQFCTRLESHQKMSLSH